MEEAGRQLVRGGICLTDSETKMQRGIAGEASNTCAEFHPVSVIPKSSERSGGGGHSAYR